MKIKKENDKMKDKKFRDEAQKILAEMNALAEKTPMGADAELLAVFLGKLHAIGWTVLTDKITKKAGKMYGHYRLADPDSEEVRNFP